MRKILERYQKLVQFVFKPLIIIWFYFYRWIQHNTCFFFLFSKTVKPSLLSLPFIVFLYLFRKTVQTIKKSFMDYTLKKYSEYSKIHYSPNGVAYANLKNKSREEKKEIFNNHSSRLAHYIKSYPNYLMYQDEDSFLEAGCGKGQNIKALMDNFPQSKIKVFDYNKGALQIIEAALGNNKMLEVEQGDFTDFSYLEKYKENSFDHVYLCNAFSFIMSDSVKNTTILRKNIINHLLRISKKSLLIIDGNMILDDKIDIKFEQNTRCVYIESFIKYFDKYKNKGTLSHLSSDDGQAVLFTKTAN